MRNRPFLLGIAVILLASPSLAGGMGNTAPIVDALTLSPTPVAANAAVTVTCSAHDPDGAVVGMTLTVTGGTLPLGTTSQAVLITSGATVTGSLVWSTPAAGAYSVRCDVNDSGGPFGGTARGSLTVAAAVTAVVGSAPVIDVLTASDTQALLGKSIHLAAAAHDPDHDAITFRWIATGGTLTGAGDTADWRAPATGGTFTVTLTVTDSTGLAATASTTLAATPCRFTTKLDAPFLAPRRVAVSPRGDLFVLDASAPRLSLLTPSGEVMGVTLLPEFATSIAVCWDRVLVGTATGKLLGFDLDGRAAGELSLAGGPLAWPAGMACDSARGLLYVAERDGARVRALWPDGSTAFTHTRAGADVLASPVDVAVDLSTRTVWVLLESYQDGTGAQLHAFTLEGNFVASAAPFGSGQGKVTRGGGLAASNGRVYVADTFQGTVQAFDATGASVGEVGSFGVGPGQLQQPSGLAATASGHLFVANTGAAHVDVFGTGAALPSCAGDADCDGLPDAWELAMGLNPHDPRDALADVDGDGLSNLQEYALGTNPRRADTDGDGFSDGEEVALGFNPLDPGDHHPSLLVRSVESNPGLVRLDSSVQGRGTCTVAWRQAAGPAVPLREATTPTPAFVARAAGAYEFEGTPSCNGVAGSPAVALATVLPVAPRAEAGRGATVKAGEPVLLDGSTSWDGNGGPLSWTWDQVLGPPLLATTSGPEQWARAYRPGLYVFALTVTDDAGLSSTQEVPVVVVDGTRPAPTALVSSPLQSAIGSTATLDASESTGPAGAALGYSWAQKSGPAVVLATPEVARCSFVPSVAGHYRFEVSVHDGPFAAPPAVVEVYVAETGAALPMALVPATVSGRIGEPLALDGARSRPGQAGSSLQYRWSQVSGPAAGLTHADAAVASVVPFASGTALFQLVVVEGDAESLPAFVRVEANVVGRVRPVAVPDALPVVTANEEVVLDGQGSTGGGQLRFRWTQVAGPWVALDDARAAQATFTPKQAGLYSFELEVESSGVWSTPVTVGVLVFPAPINGGRRP